MAFVLPLRLHEICEGHRLLTLRGRGCELQAVSGLKTKLPQIFCRRIFFCKKTGFAMDVAFFLAGF